MMRLYCQTCCREVAPAHRAREPCWLHRVILTPVALLDGEPSKANQNYRKNQKGGTTMPKAKVSSKGKAPMKGPVKGAKVPVTETAAARKARLMAKEKAKRIRK